MLGLNGFFTRFAAKVLDFDQTRLPEQQFAMIQDLLAKPDVKITGRESEELLKCVKRKHLVNSIAVKRFKNGLVFSSSGNGIQEVKSGTDLYQFVNRAFSNTDVITLRANREWVMLMPMQNSFYVVKANSALSTIELRALAREIESALKKKRFS